MGPDVEGQSTPIDGVAVIVFTTGPGITGAIVGRTSTDAQGKYAVDSLAAATYGVAVNPPSQFSFTSGTAFVQVTAGARATADFTLQRSAGP